VPPEAPSDPITDHIIMTYHAASRCRSVVMGMSGVFPLPLSTADISAVVGAYGTPLSRAELDAAVLAIDGMERQKS